MDRCFRLSKLIRSISSVDTLSQDKNLRALILSVRPSIKLAVKLQLKQWYDQPLVLLLNPPRCLRSALSPLWTQHGPLKLTQPDADCFRFAGKKEIKSIML